MFSGNDSLITQDRNVLSAIQIKGNGDDIFSETDNEPPEPSDLTTELLTVSQRN